MSKIPSSKLDKSELACIIFLTSIRLEKIELIIEVQELKQISG